MSGKDQKAPVGEGRKRPWWRRNLWFIVPVVVLLALGASYLAWDLSARRALNREIDSIRRAGEPLTLDDIVMSEVPPDLNAVTPLKEAVNVIQLTSHERELVGHGAGMPELVKKYMDEVGLALDNNEQVFSLVGEARRRNEVAWDIQWLDRPWSEEMPNFAGHRRVGRFVAVAAYHGHFTRSDDLAVERIQDVLAQGRTLAEMPALLPYLVSASILDLINAVVEEIAPGLIVGGQEGAVSREVVEALIGELLDELPQKKLRQCLLGERASVFANLRRLMGDRAGVEFIYSNLTRWQRTGLRLPFGKYDAARVLYRLGAYAEAARRDTYPGALALFPDLAERSKDWLGQLRFPVSDSVVGDYTMLFQMHFRNIANSRLAATALAMRLYELDHGHRPEKLEDLVPDYLDEVPADPFAADGSAIRLGEWGGRRLLYSVSVNGKDQGGKYSYQPDEYVDCWMEFDLVFFLDGDRPGEVYDPLADNQPLIHPGETDERDEPRGGTE